MRARSLKILSLALALMLIAGCSALKPAATSAPPVPTVTRAPGKASAPTAERYENYALHIKPVTGPELVLKEPAAAQMVLDASCTARLRVQNAQSVFGNTIDVLDGAGKKRFSFAVSSDGKQLMKAADGTVFRMPQYVYYLLEDALWNNGGTLMAQPLSWQPATGAAQPKLELDLPRLITTAMLPAFGYSEAYFCAYKIYSVNTAERNTAKIYALVTVAGYGIKDTVFYPSYKYTTPMTLTLSDTGGQRWKLTALKQPPQAKDKKTFYSYSNVRLIFPFEAMADVVTDLKDISFQTKDITRQADEYLNSVGLAGLTVES